MLDPARATGGMVTIVEKYPGPLNGSAGPEVFREEVVLRGAARRSGNRRPGRVLLPALDQSSMGLHCGVLLRLLRGALLFHTPAGLLGMTGGRGLVSHETELTVGRWAALVGLTASWSRAGREAEGPKSPRSRIPPVPSAPRSES